MTKCHTFSTVVSSTNISRSLSPQWSSSSLESYLSMFFFLLSRAAGWTLERRKNVKRKGYLFPREEMFIDSSPNAIFCLLRFFPRLCKDDLSWQRTPQWPWREAPRTKFNLAASLSRDKFICVLVKAQIRGITWKCGKQQKCTFKHMQFQVHYSVADTHIVLKYPS